MTAAGVFEFNRQGTQCWRRTVFSRQGRFFVVSVAVRTPHDLPFRAMCPRVYTAGRFTVREELMWGRQQQQQPPPTTHKDPLLRSRHPALQAEWQQAGTLQQQQQQQGEQEPPQAAGQQQQTHVQERCQAQSDKGPAGVWAKGRARQVTTHTEVPSCLAFDTSDDRPQSKWPLQHPCSMRILLASNNQLSDAPGSKQTV